MVSLYLCGYLTFNLFPRTGSIYFWQFLIFGFALPILLFIVFLKLKIISDPDASDRKERTIPFIITLALLVVLLIFNTNYAVEWALTQLTISYLATTIIILVINLFWKISAHAMTVAHSIGVLVGIEADLWWVGVAVLLMLGWSRLYLKRHTPMQVIAGTLVGFSIGFFIFRLG